LFEPLANRRDTEQRRHRHNDDAVRGGGARLALAIDRVVLLALDILIEPHDIARRALEGAAPCS